MKDTIEFCEKTIAKTKSEILNQEEEIKKHTDQEEYNEIKTTIAKFNEQKAKELKREKTAKHRKLRWNLNSKQKQEKKEKQPLTQINYMQRIPRIYANEPIPSREATGRTEPRSYAGILKPSKSRPTTRSTIYNENQIDRTATGIQSNESRSQPQWNGCTYHKSSKNLTSPQPTELLANTVEAFKLLQSNFERLVDLKTTQMEK